MSGKARPNITLADVNGFYTPDGKTVYQLVEYIPPAEEPQITMNILGVGGGSPVRGPLSQFAGYARLKPDQEIPVTKPKRPYTRKEKTESVIQKLRDKAKDARYRE